MAINTKAYIEKFLKVRNKQSNIVPFIFNKPQLKLYEVIKKQHKDKKPIRVIILKARQQGFSTISEAIILTNTATNFNTRSAVIAHTSQSTKDLFNMTKTFYENIPSDIQPHIKYSNEKELVFDKLNSQVKVYTAGGKDILRGSTVNNLHLSELAFWGDNTQEQMLGLRQAVPDDKSTMILIESTANGYNYFKELWDKAVSGENGYYPLFVGWNELEEYSKPYTGFKLTVEEERLKAMHNLTNEQLEWRRYAINELAGGDINKFKQEYPITPEEAFLSTGEGSDNFEGQFIHLKTGKQVATLTHLIDEDYFVQQMYCLGKYYNWCKLAIENNYSTYPTKELQKLDYPNQFARQREDRAVNEFTMQLGVRTTSITRPLFISYLKSIVNNDIECIKDKPTLRQMLTFIKTKKKPDGEADSKKHDDKVLALGIAYYVREQTLM